MPLASSVPSPGLGSTRSANRRRPAHRLRSRRRRLSHGRRPRLRSALPGGNVAPVVCLFPPRAGRGLRNLAPVQPIAVNGRNVGSTYLNSGDRVTIGDRGSRGVATTGPEVDAFDEPSRSWRRGRRNCKHRSPTRKGALWSRRRDEIETQCRRQAEAAEAARQNMQERENELLALRDELDRRTSLAFRARGFRAQATGMAAAPWKTPRNSSRGPQYAPADVANPRTAL